MTVSVGLDIGGTKVAGAAFDQDGKELAQICLPLPDSYIGLLATCGAIVEQFAGAGFTLGACAPLHEDGICVNIPYLGGKNLRGDLENIFQRHVPMANDANCAALAEAMEGAGKGARSVVGLIMGTGVGAGFVLDGKIIEGVNGICGEIGHLPLPSYYETDGVWGECACGKKGCVEYFINGAGLSRLYLAQTARVADGKQITALALEDDAKALGTLDRFYEIVAKAMVAVLHSFDPEVIAVSGGLSNLPGLFAEVPKRWGKYAVCREPRTKFVRACLGPIAGLRGAAWLGRSAR